MELGRFAETGTCAWRRWPRRTHATSRRCTRARTLPAVWRPPRRARSSLPGCWSSTTRAAFVWALEWTCGRVAAFVSAKVRRPLACRRTAWRRPVWGDWRTRTDWLCVLYVSGFGVVGTGRHCRPVRATHAYLLRHDADEVLVAPVGGDTKSELYAVKELDERVAVHGDRPGALTQDALIEVLETVADALVASFRALQVQALLASTSTRAKKEYELLQDHPELELMLVSSGNTGSCAQFVLPLLGHEPRWHPSKLVASEDPQSTFVPDGFSGPNFPDSSDDVVISLRYPLDGVHEGEDSHLSHLWTASLEWPPRMLLSSQATQAPPSSKPQSSVDSIAACEQSFIRQWTSRKNLIAQLHRSVIVLEYDAVDFSHVFFVLQEQLDPRSPLRIMVLRLEFTVAFSRSSRLEDLQLALLDGQGSTPSVGISLATLSTVRNEVPVADTSTASVVMALLESTRKALLQHFYEQ